MNKDTLIDFGFSEEKAESIQSAIDQLCEDLKDFNNPKDIAKAIRDSIEVETMKKSFIVYSRKSVKKECGMWKFLPYRFIPKIVKARVIIKLSQKQQTASTQSTQ